MRRSRIRALTVSLVVVGALIVALGAILAATVPWGQMAQSGSAADPGIYGPWHHWFGPGYVPWQGYRGYPAWGFFRGPRFFGGGLLILVIVVLVVSLVARRWRSYRGYDPGDRRDAEEVLRREFAEGRITEEEFTRRRDVLRK